MHIRRGFNGPGYHEIIRRDGTVEKGRRADLAGAHVRGFNSVSYGISLVGGVDSRGRAQHNATPAQMACLEKRLKQLTKKYPKAGVCGHRDLSPDRDGDGVIEPHEHLKACPCFDSIPWAASKGIRTAKIKGVWSSSSKDRTKRPVAPVATDKRTVYLQRLLKISGYEFGPVDGIIGKGTIAAVRRFQSAAGLTVNGKFDTQTVKRLRSMHEKK